MIIIGMHEVIILPMTKASSGEGERIKIAHGFSAQSMNSPIILESINYVACHDNYTLRDKLELLQEKKRTRFTKWNGSLCFYSLHKECLIHNGQSLVEVSNIIIIATMHLMKLIRSFGMIRKSVKSF